MKNFYKTIFHKLKIRSSEYCKSCESRYEEEHQVCRDLENEKLVCLERCSFDEACDNECFVLYHRMNKVGKVAFEGLSQIV